MFRDTNKVQPDTIPLFQSKTPISSMIVTQNSSSYDLEQNTSSNCQFTEKMLLR